jgi:hypothetical protein
VLRDGVSEGWRRDCERREVSVAERERGGRGLAVAVEIVFCSVRRGFLDGRSVLVDSLGRFSGELAVPAKFLQSLATCLGALDLYLNAC